MGKNIRIYKIITIFPVFVSTSYKSTYKIYIFVELVDKRLYSCNPVVGFIKPKNLRKREYKLCLNERALLPTSLTYSIFLKTAYSTDAYDCGVVAKPAR